MRMLAKVTVLVALAVAGCGSDSNSDPPAQTGPCTDVSGSYLIHYAQRAGGTCGAIPDYVWAAVPGGASMSGVGCTGADQLSADKCTETADVTCVVGDVTVNIRGTLHYTVDASSASGVFGIAKSNTAGQSCSGTFDITYTRN
jgi:hypothetical protein